MGWSAAREFRACSEPVSLPVAVSARTGREMTQAATVANNNRTLTPVRLLRNFILLLRLSQQAGPDSGHRAKVCQCRIERSEERRVGKECRCGGSAYHEKEIV